MVLELLWGVEGCRRLVNLKGQIKVLGALDLYVFGVLAGFEFFVFQNVRLRGGAGAHQPAGLLD